MAITRQLLLLIENSALIYYLKTIISEKASILQESNAFKMLMAIKNLQILKNEREILHNLTSFLTKI